ncbi:UU173 family protein [Mycoplasmopsis opalescens]|uniref:UU173 family protein n=1 Tax=Mycoplasmopsis opalescens TaxID=114886 RepID=UPI0004A6B831|nr:DUF2779 domain-containing protein [Mycoplasmopsis opalescens]
MAGKIINITSKILAKSYADQDYFIWNDDNELPQEDINGFKLYTDKFNDANENKISHNISDLFSYNNEEDEEDEEEKDASEVSYETIQKIIQEESKNAGIYWNYARDNKTMFMEAQNQLNQHLKKNLFNNSPKVQYYTGIVPIEAQKKYFDELNKILSDTKYDYLVNPTFFYPYYNDQNNNEFWLKASVLAYDKLNKIVYLGKLSASTKRTDYLNSFFVYNVLKLSKIPVKKIKIVTIDGENCHKNELVFQEAEGSNSSKDKSKAKYVHPHINSGKIFEYMTFKDSNNIESSARIINIIQSDYCIKNPRFKSKEIKDLLNSAPYLEENNHIFSIDDALLCANELSCDVELPFINFEKTISKIINAFFIEKPIYSKIKNGNLELDLELPPTKKWNNSQSNKLIAKTYADGRTWSGTSTWKVNSILNEVNHATVTNYIEKIDEYLAIPNFFTLESIRLLSLLHRKNQLIVWYDYEGLATLIPIFEGIKPYLQVTPQVSIIKTINGKIIEKENIIKDPLNIQLIDIIDVVLSVYDPKASFYVVFNQSYENSRNRELLNYIRAAYANNDKEFITKFEERGLSELKFEAIVQEIKAKSFDLLDFFKVSANDSGDLEVFYTNFIKNFSYNHTLDGIKANINEPRKLKIVQNFPKINIYCQFLKGFSSIKKIEKLISENNFKSFYPFKKYQDLEVKNGSMALEIILNRNLGKIGDEHWKVKSEKLKEYCENDVLSMLVVFDFIESLIKNTFPEIEDYKYQIEENQIYIYDKSSSKIIPIDINS